MPAGFWSEKHEGNRSHLRPRANVSCLRLTCSKLLWCILMHKHDGLYRVDLQSASCGRHSIGTSSNALAADIFTLCGVYFSKKYVGIIHFLEECGLALTSVSFSVLLWRRSLRKNAQFRAIWSRQRCCILQVNIYTTILKPLDWKYVSWIQVTFLPAVGTQLYREET
jgi:hypothetical protein